METADEIWADDLLGRRKEAEDIIGYLECVAARPPIREDGHAHVLAVDSGYGQGKTFFLRRFARHMRLTHAVAFVDAWVDDLENEPMVALAATLDKALEPWVEKSSAIEAGLAKFRSKAGRVAKIVGVGLVKRSVGFLITQGAAEALSDELGKANETEKDIGTDALKGAGSGIVDDAVSVIDNVSTPNMEARIARFREGQAAIRDMKSGLSEVVDALVDAGMQLPITIVIDELDRCRPTYAIKLLEEVKHLFDVPGIAFVLGLHGQQLAHSVTAAYGSGFDGVGYLRRFFNRRYALKEARLTPLISKLLVELAIPAGRLQYPMVGMETSSRASDQTEADALISAYMDAYGLKARDAFELMEMLQTSVALTAPHPVLLAYLLPLIIAHMRNEPLSDLVIVNPPNWVFFGAGGRFESENSKFTLEQAVRDLEAAATMTTNELMKAMNAANASPSHQAVVNLRFGNLPPDSYARPERYRELLKTVERFASM